MEVNKIYCCKKKKERYLCDNLNNVKKSLVYVTSTLLCISSMLERAKNQFCH